MTATDDRIRYICDECRNMPRCIALFDFVTACRCVPRPWVHDKLVACDGVNPRVMCHDYEPSRCEHYASKEQA